MDVMPAPQGPGLPSGPWIKREVDLAFSKEEARVNDALMSAMAVPRELFQTSVAGYTPRQGFMKREPTISEVLDTGRVPGPDARMDYSGSYGSYSGTSRPGLGMM